MKGRIVSSDFTPKICNFHEFDTLINRGVYSNDFLLELV